MYTIKSVKETFDLTDVKDKENMLFKPRILESIKGVNFKLMFVDFQNIKNFSRLKKEETAIF